MMRRILSKLRDININGMDRISWLLAKLLLEKPKDGLVINTLYNFKLKVDPLTDKGVEQSIYYFGTYEKGTLYIIENILQLGDTFLDVGANIGLISIFASRRVGETGHIIAFEPNPATNRILVENIELNNCKNIQVEKYAVGKEIQSSPIYDRWDVNRGGASMIKPQNPTSSHIINETTLSSFLSDIDEIKLIKIDVEGYEMNVIIGAQQFLENSKNPPSLIVEFSANRMNTFGKDVTPLFEKIQELNLYRFYKGSSGKERISKLVEITNTDQLPTHDNVYCFTDAHLKNLPQIIFKT